MCLVEIKKQSIKFLITFNTFQIGRDCVDAYVYQFTSEKNFHGKVNFKFDNLYEGLANRR